MLNNELTETFVMLYGLCMKDHFKDEFFENILRLFQSLLKRELSIEKEIDSVHAVMELFDLQIYGPSIQFAEELYFLNSQKLSSFINLRAYSED